ncbi:MAG: hypothetical protein JOY99_10165 [Sphingomonadaceae bacterium]|nr:hypothetical protein [Sphingomonadaceae bacterium]
MLHAPDFSDREGRYLDHNIDTVFKGFNESIDNLRRKLGEERCAAMRQMSDRMQALFASDPSGTNGGSKAGRQIIREMELMLRRKRAAPNETPPAA